MFATKFKTLYDARLKCHVIIYRKWYQLSWHTMAVNNDPYHFDNTDAANYMAKCMEDAGL